MESVLLPLLTTTLSIALGLSPLKTVKDIEAQEDTRDVSFIPYVAIMINSILACYYGLFVYNHTIVIVNCINGALSIYYIWVYHKYTRDKKTLQFVLMGTMLGIFMIWYHIYYQAGEDGRTHLGILSNIATVAMFASPLSTLSLVIKTKNATSIPVFLSVASLACSVTWFLFGLKIGDIFVITPNIIGILLASCQLLLVAKYGQKKPTKLELSDV